MQDVYRLVETAYLGSVSLTRTSWCFQHALIAHLLKFANMAHRPRKVCFVTIGATAPFDTLLSKVLDNSFLEELAKHGYTTLLIQHGKEGRAIFDSYNQKVAAGSPDRHGLDIQGFGFKQDGLLQEMRLAKANDAHNFVEGMILSHAGKLSYRVIKVMNFNTDPNQVRALSWKLYASVSHS